MYLFSVYFDKKTEDRIKTYVNDVEMSCGNTFMTDNSVPPHMTISAFETREEDRVVEMMATSISNIKKNKVELVTVGTFPTVIFIQPVLNEYLHNISSMIYDKLVSVPNVKISKYYKPFSWLPHVTIGKQLTDVEMRMAFDVLQKSFGMFEGEIVRIELAKKNPYRVIASWEL